VPKAMTAAPDSQDKDTKKINKNKKQAAT